MRWTIEQRGDRWAVVRDDGLCDSASWLTERAAQDRADRMNVTLVAAAEPDRGSAFYAVLAIDEWQTEDGRYVETFDWAEPLPLPMMALTTNEGGGHWGAELCGRIETIEKMGDGRRVLATGTFDATDCGAMSESQVRGQSLRFVSVDPAAVEVEEEITVVDSDGWPIDGQIRFTSYTIGGATLCPFPAIRMAVCWCDGMDAPEELSQPLPDPIPPVTIPEVDGVEEGDIIVIRASAIPQAELGILVDDPAQRTLLAGAAAPSTCDLTEGCGGPALPPAQWFTDPHLEQPTPADVTREGRVYGHLALWDMQHRGFLNYQAGNVFAPRNHSGYAQFHVHSTPVACCDDPDCGHDRTTVRTGVLTLGTGHADKRARSIAGVLAHYENSGLACADVVVGEDAHGIWFSGALRPNTDDERVRELLGASPSGDWRGINGALELCAILMVNCGGFPITASAYEDHGEVVTLIAGYQSERHDESEADALVASLGGGRQRVAVGSSLRAEVRQEIERALDVLDRELHRRFAPIERDIELLRPLAAEALVREITEAAMLDGSR